MSQAPINIINLTSQQSKGQQSKGVVTIGSSVTEIFDYIFGDNPLYHSFWCAGWFASALLEDNQQKYIEHIISPIDRDALIILCFGSFDVYFGYTYEKQNKENFNMDIFSQRIVDGTEKTKKTLNSLGFNNIYNVLYCPIPDFPLEYWDNLHVKNQVPAAEMADVLKLIAKKFSIDENFINLIPEFSTNADSYIAGPQYQRPYNDHHLDYIKIQEILWQHVKHLPGILPHIKQWHTETYPFILGELKTLIANQETRERTCRN